MSENEPASTVPLEPSFRIVGDPGPLFSALAAARPNYAPITRSKKVRVQPATGPAYEFLYAPLETVIDATAPALAAEGLTLIQPCYAVGGGHEVRTILAHSSGSYLESIMYIPGTVRYFNKEAKEWQERALKIQELGSEITYKRRYSAQCVLGVNAEDDDDGNAADGNEVQAQQQRPSRSQPTPPAPRKPPEQRKPPQPDPQMQADIDRRKAQAAADAAIEAQATAAIRSHEAEEPASVADKLAAAKSALAQAEESQGVAPAVVSEKTPSQYPAAPAADALPDSHVPDNVQLPKGAATREAMRRALNGAGIIESAEMAAKVLAVTGVDPRLNPLNYGNARAVLAALAAQ